MKPGKTVVMVEDHILLRDALANFINDLENYTVIAKASNGKEMIGLLNKGCSPDIILLDLNMPEMDGYAAAEWLQVNRPQIKVIILTMNDSEVILLRLLQAGVKGFLKKSIDLFDLKSAMDAVTEDEYYYCNSATVKLASFFNKTKDGLLLEKSLLAEKEIQFLKLVSTDLTYKEIALKLNMTVRAIDAYRDSMFEKLNVKSRIGLVIYAIKNGIVSFN